MKHVVLILLFLLSLGVLISCGSTREGANPLAHPNSARIISKLGLSQGLQKDLKDKKFQYETNCIALVETAHTRKTYLIGLKNPCPQNNMITNFENTSFYLTLGLTQTFKKREYTELILDKKWIVGYISKNPLKIEGLCNYPKNPTIGNCEINIDQRGHLGTIVKKNLEKNLTVDSKVEERLQVMANIFDKDILSQIF
jgi:hypothetical protein